MKNLFIPLLLASVALSANTQDLSWVDEQVNAIKPPRDGESTRNIARIKDPFIFLKKNATEEDKKKTSVSQLQQPILSNINKSTTNSSTEKPVVFSKHSFSLGAIINTTAFINGKWFKLGDNVNGYKITNIAKKTVTLNNGSKTKVLSTATKNTNLKFKR